MGLVTGAPEHMYDFKMGHWDIAWKNKNPGKLDFEFTAVSDVYAIMDGDILIDAQISDFFKGITYRTYNHKTKEWVVRWLPANSIFEPTISAQLENCVPVEYYEEMTENGKLSHVRVRFINITKNSFEFHQDWSVDEGKTWAIDRLFYKATRMENKPDNRIK